MIPKFINDEDLKKKKNYYSHEFYWSNMWLSPIFDLRPKFIIKKIISFRYVDSKKKYIYIYIIYIDFISLNFGYL